MYPTSSYDPQYPPPMSCARKAAFAFTLVLSVMTGLSMVMSMINGKYGPLSGLAVSMCFCMMGITGIQRRSTCLMMAYIVYLIISIVLLVIAIIICILLATGVFDESADSSATRSDSDSAITIFLISTIVGAVIALIIMSLTLYFTIKARKEILEEAACVPGQNPYPLPHGQSAGNYGWPNGNVTVQQSDRSDWTGHPSQLENESDAPTSPYDKTQDE